MKKMFDEFNDFIQNKATDEVLEKLDEGSTEVANACVLQIIQNANNDGITPTEEEIHCSRYVMKNVILMALAGGVFGMSKLTADEGFAFVDSETINDIINIINTVF